MAGRTLLSGVVQWDPVVDLNLFRFSDGYFRCAGVRNRTTDPCGFRIEKDKSKDVSRFVYNMSLLAPQTSVSSLESLATSCLCYHHTYQIGVKVTAWTDIVRHHPLTKVRASYVSNISYMGCDSQTGIRLPLTYELDASTETSGQFPPPQHGEARQSSTEQIESLLAGMKQLQVTTTSLETRLEEVMADTSQWKQSESRTRRIGCLSGLFSKYRTKGG